MQLVDTHAHLTHPDLAGQLEDVLENARCNGIYQIISIASDYADSMAAVELAARYAGVFASVGIHPHEAGKAAAADVDSVMALAGRDQVVALGEMGLDYHYDFSDRESQRAIFKAQLERAVDIDLPLVIHCRDAFEDCVALLVDCGHAGRRVVFHCFSGTEEEGRRIAEHGWRISFTGIVTFKRSVELQQIARQYPADQVMLETDSPYLSPVPVRHVRPNQPAHLLHTAEFLADLRDVDVESLADQTTRNARLFFHLPETSLPDATGGTS